MIIDFLSSTKSYTEQNGLKNKRSVDEAYSDNYKDDDGFKDRIINTIRKATSYINDRYDFWERSKCIPYYAEQFSHSAYLKKIKARIQYWFDSILNSDSLKIKVTDADVKLLFGKDNIDDYTPIASADIDDRVTFSKDSIDIILDKVKIFFLEERSTENWKEYSHAIMSLHEKDTVKEGKLSNNASYIFSSRNSAKMIISALPLKLEWPSELDNLEYWFKEAFDKALCEQFPWAEIYPLFCDYLDDRFLDNLDN